MKDDSNPKQNRQQNLQQNPQEQGVSDRDLVMLGKINGVFGVRGWVKVFSETDPRQNIVQYRQWFIRSGAQAGDRQWQSVKVLDGRLQGKNVVARLEGCDDMDGAERLRGYDIAVSTDAMPALKAGEYYWKDLVGLPVFDTSMKPLGPVKRLFETGANDVLVVSTVDGESLIPWVTEEVVKRVVLDGDDKGIVVDWDIHWDDNTQ